MNYSTIHDSIIDRAMSRLPIPKIYYESHHILPKCEGGDPDGPQVLLTFKEHRLVHKLRYKMTGVMGNLCAYNLMKYGEEARLINVRLANHCSHAILKEKDPEKYSAKQRKSGILGGKKAYQDRKGFHSMSKEEMRVFQVKGSETLVREKIGMFSEEYRKYHRTHMQKVVLIDGIEFKSCSDAARHFNVVNGTISYWIKTGKAVVVHEGKFSYKGKTL